MKILICLLIYMSVSGSAFFLGYLLLDFLTHEMLPASFRYFLLKLGGLFFLVPFPLVKSLVQSWLFHCENGILKTDEYYFFDIDHSIKLIDEGFIFPQLPDSQKVLIGLWTGIMLLIILSQAYRFYLFRCNLRKYLLPFDNCEDLLNSIKADMNITKKVSMYYCGAEISPFTCGVKSPVIILTSLVADDSKELILRHELQHIKSHDLIYRMVALFIVLIHCFNPLSYLFLKELKEVQEMNCDEKLTVTFSNNERMKYGKAIIAVSARTGAFSAPVLYFSGNSKSFLIKRIRKISVPGRIRKLQMALATIVLCLFATVPVFAYSPEIIDLRNFSSDIQNGIGEVTWMEFEFDSSSDTGSAITIPEDENLFSDCNQYFLLEDGTVILLPDRDIQLFSGCKHSFKTGVLKKHISSGKSCTVNQYRGEICTKCNYIKNKTLVNSVYSSVCPHKK